MSTGMLEMSKQSVVPVLWLDDQPGPLEDIARWVLQEDLGIQIRFIENAVDAETALESGEYGALVVDCRLGNDDNGAEFLLRVNQEYPCLPTLVYTGYSHDPLYADALRVANTVYQEDRLSTHWKRPVSKMPLIAKLREWAIAYHKVKDLEPEKIRFRDYEAHPEDFLAATEVHWMKHRLWIERQMHDSGWVWAVACGLRLQLGSADLFDFPDEDRLREIGRRTNLIPFAYSQRYVPETIDPQLGDTTWSTTSFASDFYPTLRVKFGQNDLVHDFDTGAYQTHVSDRLVPLGLLDFARSSSRAHLDRVYKFVTKQVSATLVLNDGSELVGKIPVCVVKEWDDSSFRTVNASRRALLGRDILRAFPVEVVLDSVRRETRVFTPGPRP